ncbi:MAG: FAD-binding protein [Gammaproteobacteria bacterium]|nr:FAD-binding protein [Gammaproteobacteria bacterium]MCW8910551.1 FAD-binding protein [Gammaproteobacteria bacterium]MCW9004116.1 FAD-binding protein [Gammaproteobacteria bacterium]MCW9055233.1 FAD-binding protein [Gammaproteobacteria bacterium]
MNKHLLRSLKKILNEDSLLTEPAECIAYSYDNSRRQHQPDIVALPQTEQQVIDIIVLCNQSNTPVTARGRGTGTTGATVPTLGGLVLSFEKMNSIIKVDPDNRVIQVQPGVTNQQVQNAAAEFGFFWAPDPTSAAFCSVGGNLAYNSAGPRAVKYGTCRENTLGLRAVTGDGKIIRCGTYTTKGVVGYDLTRLIIGSEGTLAVITEATLKLLPKPETKSTLKATYRTMEAAAQAVSNIMSKPVTPCALEFMDSNALNIVRDYSQADLPDDAGAMLMIEVDGNLDHINNAVDAIKKASIVNGHIETVCAKTEAETKALWETRKALSPSLRKIAPKKINEDIVVPVSHMATLINELNKLSNEYDIPIINFGHAGNGNIHVNLLINPDNHQEVANAEQCLDRIFDLVLSLNGTLSGEHGIGLEKRDFIYKELSSTEINLMNAIKQQFDPNNILNADKILLNSN